MSRYPPCTARDRAILASLNMNGHHQSEMSEALRIAVERGHIERVVDLLKRGAPSGAFLCPVKK